LNCARRSGRYGPRVAQSVVLRDPWPELPLRRWSGRQWISGRVSSEDTDNGGAIENRRDPGAPDSIRGRHADHENRTVGKAKGVLDHESDRALFICLRSCPGRLGFGRMGKIRPWTVWTSDIAPHAVAGTQLKASVAVWPGSGSCAVAPTVNVAPRRD